MPRIIDYPLVLQQLTASGLTCLYHNSGAFGLGTGEQSHTIGWIGADDPTIRDAARNLTHHVPPPFDSTLASLAIEAWQSLLSGPAWLMPKSHWAYELQFGSGTWLPAALQEAEIDPRALRDRNNGAAIAFSPGEAPLLRRLLQQLLLHLDGSDFSLAFPPSRTVCTVHHHGQLWWTSDSAQLADRLRQLAEAAAMQGESV